MGSEAKSVGAAVGVDGSRTGSSLRMDEGVEQLGYVKGARARALSRLGIETLRDLLYDAPRRYMDFSDITPILQCQVGEKANVLGQVHEVSTRTSRRRMKITRATVTDDSGMVEAVWFNQPWVSNALSEGKTVLLQGSISFRGGFKQMKSPEYMVLEGDSDAGIRPVYRQTRGVTSAWVSRFVDEAMDVVGCPVDPLPVWLRTERGLVSRQCALRMLHHPVDMGEVPVAKRRLAYEELLLLQLHWMQERDAVEAGSPARRHIVDGPKSMAFGDAIPFELTSDQRDALDAILSDMSSPKRMNRMLLGDVGTGKTIVAAGAFAAVSDTGTQAVLMAPTEVLARQYGEKVGPVLDRLGIRWATLTSSTPASERGMVLSSLAGGQTEVLFATHAVLEDDVRFADLSLAVVDEQHRFGVGQREKLRSKGKDVDYLCMTATPIPRSLALTVYGDLDCSYIRQRPGGNRPIETVVMEKENRFAAFDEIRECVAQGHQAYIICPLIGESGKRGGEDSGKRSPSGSDGEADDVELDARDRPLDEEDLESMGGDLKAARAEAEYLQTQVFPNMNIGLLCGQQSPSEKSETMASFARGDIDVLVSTTVVEVGVDVPNATLMVVEDAERFGLSQLHQLRGRVGRGESPGKAILLASTRTEVSAKRMSYIEQTQDGFELAELDLSLRREGDVVGNRQHGLPSLRFSNVVRDSDLIEQARADAARILDVDPLLEHPANALLRHEVNAIYSQPDGSEADGGRGGR